MEWLAGQLPGGLAVGLGLEQSPRAWPGLRPLATEEHCSVWQGLGSADPRARTLQPELHLPGRFLNTGHSGRQIMWPPILPWYVSSFKHLSGFL